MIKDTVVLANADVASRGRPAGRRLHHQPVRGKTRQPGSQLSGLAGTPYWTTREAVAAIGAPPESLCVVGGGTVGIELAQGFARAGTQVRIIESARQLLPLEEPETAELLTAALIGQGVQVQTAVTVRSVRHRGDEFTLELAGDAAGERVGVQRLLVPADLSLASAADGTGRTPGRPGPAVPRVTYTDPQFGAVGLTEAQAEQHGLTVRVGFSWVPSPSQDQAGEGGTDGFIKLVEDAAAGTLVGATVTGSLSTRMISELTTAVQATVVTAQIARLMDPGSPRCRRAIEDLLAKLR